MWFRIGLLAAVLTLGGCATTSVFTPYPAQAAGYRQALSSGDPSTTLSALEKKRKSADRQLYLLERGRLAQLSGDAEASRTDLAEVIGVFEQQEDKARISLSSVASTTGSFLTNDNARPYVGRLYEQVFVHQYQALNYLALGDAQGALVEVRRANLVQTEALNQREREVVKAQNKAAEQSEAADFDPGQFDSYFNDMDAAAGRVKTAFQNAATFYLSGLIYEATGLPNDAYIDYRKALELVPDNPYLQRDVVRLGRSLRMPNIDALEKKAGKPIPLKAGDGELVVYAEEGYVPTKQPLMIPLPTSKTLNYVGFPVYPGPFPAPLPLQLGIGGQTASTAVLVDTQALAVRALREELPAMLARAYLRLLSKQKLQRELNDRAGPLAGLVGTVYSLVSEQPDLRSWLTLPNSAQLLRQPLNAGEHRLRLPDGSELAVTVRPGRPTLVHLVVTEGKAYSRIYPL